MRLHSLMLTSALAIGLAVPAMAQQSVHRYITNFRYSDTAIKAMTENPQDRAAQIAKLYESFGGKMESAYWLPSGSEYDGMVIGQFPDEVKASRRSGSNLLTVTYNMKATPQIANT